MSSGEEKGPRRVRPRLEESAAEQQRRAREQKQRDFDASVAYAEEKRREAAAARRAVKGAAAPVETKEAREEKERRARAAAEQRRAAAGEKRRQAAERKQAADARRREAAAERRKRKRAEARAAAAAGGAGGGGGKSEEGGGDGGGGGGQGGGGGGVAPIVQSSAARPRPSPRLIDETNGEQEEKERKEIEAKAAYARAQEREALALAQFEAETKRRDEEALKAEEDRRRRESSERRRKEAADRRRSQERLVREAGEQAEARRLEEEAAERRRQEEEARREEARREGKEEKKRRTPPPPPPPSPSPSPALVPGARTSPIAVADTDVVPGRSRIGEYLLGAQLGAGAGGQVHEALDLRTDRRVAVKRIPAREDEPDTTYTGPGGEFVAEVAVHAALLRHPDVVRVYAVLRDPFRRYGAALVLERGVSDLDAVLRTAKRRFEIASGDENDVHFVAIRDRWARETLCALGYLHEMGFLHLDLKPQNILLVREPTTPPLAPLHLASVRAPAPQPLDGRELHAKIADYGLVRPLSDRFNLWSGRAPFQFVTLTSRAPELMFGRSYGRPSDLWSYGIVLLQLYFGVDFLDSIRRYANGGDLTEVAALRAIYEHFGWPDEFRARMRAVVIPGGRKHSDPMVAPVYALLDQWAPKPQMAPLAIADSFLTADQRVRFRRPRWYGEDGYLARWQLIAACLQVDPPGRVANAQAHALLFTSGGGGAPAPRCRADPIADVTYATEPTDDAAALQIKLDFPTFRTEVRLMAASLLRQSWRLIPESRGGEPAVVEASPTSAVPALPPSSSSSSSSLLSSSSSAPRPGAPATSGGGGGRDSKTRDREWAAACLNLASKHLNGIEVMADTNGTMDRARTEVKLEWLNDRRVRKRVADHERRILEVVRSGWLARIQPTRPAPPGQDF